MGSQTNWTGLCWAYFSLAGPLFGCGSESETPFPRAEAPGNGGAAAGESGGATGGGAAPGTGGSAAGGNGAGTGGVAAGGGAVGGNASGGNASGGNASGGNASGGNASGGSEGATGGSSGVGGSEGNVGPVDPFTFGEPPEAVVHFQKGINLGNRLEAPTEGEWGGSILASDFPHIAARGFDHVRIPIRFSGHALASAPYTIDATFFQRIDTVLDQATAAGLAVILDMHSYEEMATNPSGEQARFLALWAQIAERYRDRPETVAFEPLNEPNGQLDSQWNAIVAAAIAAIRATNPRRLLVIDTVFWADPNRLSLLTLPDDANLLVSIHLYEPKLFSFQGKDWMGDPYMTTGVVFPGPPASPISPVQAALDQSWAATWFTNYNTKPAAENPSGPATIDAQMAYITSYMSSSGRTVGNGEWGPQDGGDMTSRAQLVSLVRQRCEAEGVPWAIWEDPNNMQLFDSAAGTWVTPIVDALLP